MKIQREEFLRALERAQAGLSPRKAGEQSTCYNFGGGAAVAFDGVSTWARSVTGLDNTVEGAVEGKPLLDAIRRIADETVDVSMKDGKLTVKGEDDTVRMSTAPNMHPAGLGWTAQTQWYELDQAFSDALDMVQSCAGKDAKDRWITTTVNVTPDFVEAGDGFQVCRYMIPVPVEVRCVVARDAIKNVVAAGMTECHGDESWLHFRSPDGTHLSFRRHVDAFPDASRHYALEGEPLTLPKSMSEAVLLAEGFLDDRDAGRLLVELDEDEVRVIGQSSGREVTTKRPCRYAGPPLRFMAGPKVLQSVLERSANCFISPHKLLIDGGPWRYVCSLIPPE